MGTTGFGIFFILFGVLLYFDSVLLAFGNVSAPALSTAPNLPEVSIAGVNPKFLQIVLIQWSGTIKPGQVRVAGDGQQVLLGRECEDLHSHAKLWVSP